jgi:hypothetical protein
MENKKGIELIKLEVLGCISEKDSESLLKMKENDDNFPWKTLAEYQNLVSLLPLTLTLNFPDNDLKDKTATKLYKIRDEIKAKLDAKKPKETPAEQVVEKKSDAKEVVLEEVAEEIQIKEEEISLDEDKSVKAQTSAPEKTFTETSKYETENKSNITSKAVPDRELMEKIIRDYFKTYIEKELNTLKQGMKKTRLLSLALFLFAIILIVVLYFIG